MAWFAISGVDLSAIAATAQEPKGDRRDIGEAAPASDGSMRVTRQTRKRDLSFTSIPLSGSDAFAWESLITGEGHHWSFDSSLYSSKGLGPSSSTNTSQVTAGGAKFGAGYLQVGNTTGTITYAAAVNSGGGTGSWTVLVWRFESGAWHHYVVTSGGHKWLDGVRADGTSTTWLTVSGANVTIANSTGSVVQYDDLVVLPYVTPDAWPPLIFNAATVAFSDLPYLTVAGLLVPEAATRKMSGTCTIAAVKRGNVGSGLAKDVQTLQVELKGA